MKCSLLGSSDHGIIPARILEWVAISSSRGPSQPRDWTLVSCIGRWNLYHWAIWEIHFAHCGEPNGILIMNVLWVWEKHERLLLFIQVSWCSILFLKFISFFFFIFWSFLLACGILFLDQGLDPGPHQWKLKVLTPGLREVPPDVWSWLGILTVSWQGIELGL